MPFSDGSRSSREDPGDVDEVAIPVIERNVRLQSQLIEDLLDMSRIEAGKVSLDLQKIDLATVVIAAMDTLRPTAESKACASPPPFPATSWRRHGRPRNRLQQVVWNLLTCAPVKFTPRNGRVHVLIERLQFACRDLRRRHRQGHRARIPQPGV